MKRVVAIVVGSALVTAEAAAQNVSEAALLEAQLRQQWSGIDQQIQLRRIDQEALGEVNRWREGEDAPSPESGKDGRVVFEFGPTVPRIICAPLRICDVELQAGEQLMGAPLVGDGAGWLIEPAFSGATPHVVVKPKVSGISTNLAVYTDRRVYHLELQATENDHMPFVSFSYPEDRKAKWLALAAQHRTTSSPSSTSDEAGDYEITATPEALNFNYDISRGGRWRVRRRIDWEPKRAFDDGEKTIIEMPRSVLARELPVLFVREADGKDKIVNYRVKGTHFVVDRLFSRAVLVKGVGRHQERVVIEREED